MDERVSLHTTTKEEYSVGTLEEVAGELEPAKRCRITLGGKHNTTRK